MSGVSQALGVARSSKELRGSRSGGASFSAGVAAANTWAWGMPGTASCVAAVTVTGCNFTWKET